MKPLALGALLFALAVFCFHGTSLCAATAFFDEGGGAQSRRLLLLPAPSPSPEASAVTRASAVSRVVATGSGTEQSEEQTTAFTSTTGGETSTTTHTTTGSSFASSIATATARSDETVETEMQTGEEAIPSIPEETTADEGQARLIGAQTEEAPASAPEIEEGEFCENCPFECESTCFCDTGECAVPKAIGVRPVSARRCSGCRKRRCRRFWWCKS